MDTEEGQQRELTVESLLYLVDEWCPLLSQRTFSKRACLPSAQSRSSLTCTKSAGRRT